MELKNQVISERMKQYVKGEGYRTERLAKLMGKSNSSFYDGLAGKLKNTAQFAVDLATVLGLKTTYFIEETFSYKPSYEEHDTTLESMIFSAGMLSDKGKEGLEKIRILCELVELYHKGEHA